jgi:hypothetical protein
MRCFTYWHKLLLITLSAWNINCIAIGIFSFDIVLVQICFVSKNTTSNDYFIVCFDEFAHCLLGSLWCIAL